MKKIRLPNHLLFFIILFVSAAVRCVISAFPKVPVYQDEVLNLEIAQNIWLNGSASLFQAQPHYSKLLYPLFLAPFYAIGNGSFRLIAISVFNAILISSSLIPAYLLARRVLRNPRHVFLALMVLAVSPNLLFSVSYLSENLYYPLLLWGIYAVCRVFSSENRNSASAILLGILSVLLYLTKETGMAFFFSVLALYCYTWAAEGKSHGKTILHMALYLAASLLPWVILRFVLFRAPDYFYERTLLVDHLTTTPLFFFLFFAALLIALFFTVSLFALPVLVPLSRFGVCPSKERKLMFFAAMYVVFASLGVSGGILVFSNAGNPTPPLFLQYLMPAFFPFLLLFLNNTQLNPEDEKKQNRLLIILCSLCAAVTVVLLYIPEFASPLDSPVLSVFRPVSITVISSWVMKGSILVIISLLLVLFLKRKKTGAMITLSLLFILSAANNCLLLPSIRDTWASNDSESAVDWQTLDTFLEKLDGNILLIADDPDSCSIRGMNALVKKDFYIATPDAVRDVGKTGTPPGQLLLSRSGLPTPWPELYGSESVPCDHIDYLICADEIPSFLIPESYSDITPSDIHGCSILSVSDHSVLSMYDPLTYTINEELSFYGSSPTFRNFLYSGFSGTEETHTWSEGNEAVLVLSPDVENPVPLSARLTWFMKIGSQSCLIYSGDTLLFDGLLPDDGELIFTVPAESYDEYGRIHLRFVFPDAAQPNIEDTRLLALGFRTLTLEREPVCYSGDMISFTSSNPTYQNYKPSGFSGPEDTFTWTDGTESSLSFLIQPMPSGSLSATLTWEMVIGNPYCRLYAGENCIYDDYIPDGRSLNFEIPLNALDESGHFTLRFEWPKAAPPGNGDPRLLSVAFSSLCFISN